MRKNSLWKKAVCTALCVALGMSATLFKKIPASAQTETLTGKTAMEIQAMMDKGFNIGNTFDATGGSYGDIVGHETSWGNPQVNKELIDGIKAAGYSTVRIPCTWAKHMDKSNNYAIEPEFLERVKEVIDWCYEDELFVILNVHHEGWLNKETFCDDREAIGSRLGILWSQVAEYFKDYDQHLIFEGMNEPRAQGTSYEWTGNEEGYKTVNYLNQVFVDAVRGNGQGYNAERVLGIPGYAASNSAAALRAIEIPQFNGEPLNNAMISIHCYSPYEFCLTDQQKTFSETTPSDTADIKRMLSDIKSLFNDNGIAAYIGECGATNSGNNIEARIAWFNYFGKVTREAGVPAIVWDNGVSGSSGGECHKYFNRKTGELNDPELSEAFIYGYDPTAKAENVVFDFEPAKQGSNTIVLTPTDLGFAPKQLMNQAKINHTEGAPVGFSLKVSKDVENQTALYDVTRFKGNFIKVTAYVLCENSEVSVGYTSADKFEAAKLSSGAEWQEVVMAINVSEDNDTVLYFAGSNEENFFIDDISIELIDGVQFNEIASGSASVAPEPDGEVPVEDDVTVTLENNDTSDSKEKSSSTTRTTGIIALLVIAVSALTIAVRKKAKKPEDK